MKWLQYETNLCTFSSIWLLLLPINLKARIVVCKRRKKRKTRRPDYWRTFWSFRQFATHYRQLGLSRRQRVNNYRVTLSPRAYNQSWSRVLRFIAPFTHYYVDDWGCCVQPAGGCWWLLVMAGNCQPFSLLMRRNNFLISERTPCSFICASLINRPCIIP